MPLNFSVTAMTMLIAMTLALAPFAATSIQAKPTGATSKKSSAAKEIVWESSWKEATAKAKASGKPIMLDFYTDWCGWCKRLDRDVYTHPAIISQLGGRMIFLKVNPERSPSENNLALRYKAGSFPTVVVIDAQKNEKGRIEGYLPPERFLVSILDTLR
ncbi:MAG: thioredoxin family protein [Candidatus Obscuribacter sp.]|jgi:thiol:disulfide interchange protein|nr:thioredoxin family protein [Candidatus Obscuribacter sp.]MDQ5964213.1 hypothetical protein [Cyanobacteriota bacterium erpe_2018_sw_39hr_WHONDRS-SW48-000098_B_bin.30]MBK7836150.1 thioredoxin family protein [Candidatus Obscuribacter sp.]MBK9617987.1 thioredoxin family protein [Candidatus Obscuribacter sp.]MBK9770215.1 thioredoxin family protein [Candidatus Obscuribacter sp.]